jgi:hypothetical protein
MMDLLWTLTRILISSKQMYTLQNGKGGTYL